MREEELRTRSYHKVMVSSWFAPIPWSESPLGSVKGIPSIFRGSRRKMLYLGAPEELEAHLGHFFALEEPYSWVESKRKRVPTLQSRFLIQLLFFASLSRILCYTDPPNEIL